MSTYAEMVAATNFSFLRGASPGANMVLTALLLGHAGLGIADRNTLAGVVRAWATLRALRQDGLPPVEKLRDGGSPGEHVWLENPAFADLPFTAAQMKAMAARFRLVTGARLVFADATPDIVAYPADRAGWGQLCRLLTLGHRRARKGDCILHLDDLVAHVAGLLLVVLPDRATPTLLAQLRDSAPRAVWLGATMHHRGDDGRRLARLRDMARTAGVPLLAVNDVLYDSPAQRDLQDVLTCIREGTTIEAAGRKLEANAERHLKTPAEMARLFRDAPEAIEATRHLLGRIGFDLSELKHEYPDEPVPPGWQAQDWLAELTHRGARTRYPDGVPAKVAALLDQELALIAKLEYARYFLTIRQIVAFADSRGILCQGRGSAANSAVCYVLGITAVDPAAHDVLFARFISEERREPPDIDVDFEHERREEVIQWIYATYGRERAALVATVIHYRPRSAIREVGRVLGLTEDITARLAGMQWGSWDGGLGPERVRQAGLDPDNPVIRQATSFAERLLGFPRHLSQHVGGFVLARGRLDEMVPVGNAAMPNRTFIEWDKDDISALGLMKVDVLALGMLSCIRKAFELLRQHEGIDWGLADVPREDPATYDMLCAGKSLGVFQVESRAQMNMLPRLKPRRFYDLVIQVAIVRPGPIQGDMVHPYLRRRNKLEKPDYPSPAPPHDPDELKAVLEKTEGVPLFQEQAMKLAMVAAEFNDEEANGLRRAMATFRNVGTIGAFETKMVGRMVARGYQREFAQRCFEQIKGFGSYGFPESHAASFAKLVYISSYLKCHHPAVFACALLNAQPMGFYAPAQIVREAQENGGVEPRPVDVNHSDWDNTLEPGAPFAPLVPFALRLGLRQVDGFAQAWGRRIEQARGARSASMGFSGVEELMRHAGLPARAMRLLADADAFRSLGLDRREALWAVRRLPDDDALPLFAAAATNEMGVEVAQPLPEMALHEHVVADYQTVRLSLKGHPVGLLRPGFQQNQVVTCAEANALPDGRRARVAGVVLVRQRPGSGNAIFITIEDETGIINVVLWARQFEAFRHAVMSARLMLVEGLMQKSPEGVVHLMARDIEDRTADLLALSDTHAATIAMTRADEVLHPHATPARHPREVRILPKSRDFH